MRQDENRLEREAAFFDRFYANVDDAYDMAVFKRYSELSHRRLYSKEYRVDVLGDLRGKRVIDIGCGPGENAVLLALLGAEVTGIDISPVAIEKANALASSAGVSERCTFKVQSFESFPEGHGQFDIVWVDAFLHHVIPVLEEALDALILLCADGAQLVITEPVRTSALARAARRLFPAGDATPDERPLESAELAMIENRIAITSSRRFNGVGRLSRFALQGHSYERATPTRRAASDLFARIDKAILPIPVLGEFVAGTLVLVGSPRQGPDTPVR